MEKLAFSLVTAARKVKPYFQAHVIKVLTNHSLKKAMNKLEATRELIQGAVELSEFDVWYRPKEAIKAQVLVDFFAEFAMGCKVQTRGQSSGSFMQMAHPHSMQEELGQFYAHQKEIIWSTQSVYSSKEPIMKLNIKLYFRAWSQLNRLKQIQSSSKETHSW